MCLVPTFKNNFQNTENKKIMFEDNFYFEIFFLIIINFFYNDKFQI